MWDIRDGKCIRSLTPQGSTLGSLLSSMTSETLINDLTLVADGPLLLAAMGNTVSIWDLDRWVHANCLWSTKTGWPHVYQSNEFAPACFRLNCFLLPLLLFKGENYSCSVRFSAVHTTSEIISLSKTLVSCVQFPVFILNFRRKDICWSQHSCQNPSSYAFTRKFRWNKIQTFCFHFDLDSIFYI